MTTPRLGAPELTSGQATPETTVNEQIRYIESGAGHFIFEDRDLATPPGSPADGDCYLVAASPTGAWSGQAGKIAFRVNTAWAFITVIEGFTAWVNDEDAFIAYDGSAWVGASAIEATDSEMWTGTSTTTRVSPRRIFSAAAPVSVAYSATVTLDGNTGINFEIGTLTGNITLANPTNMKAGQSGTIRLVQDATGSRTISFGSNWRLPGGAAANLLSTTANAVDLLSYQVRSGGVINATLSKDMKA